MAYKYYTCGYKLNPETNDLVWSKEEVDITEQVDGEWNVFGPEEKEEPRVCAICLNGIVRSKYDKHMQEVHGYETLNLGEARRLN